jgi:hypothetical protein
MVGGGTNIIGRGIALALAWLAFGSASATSLDDTIGSWMTEPGVSPPSYAATEPVESDLNVDTVVLLCSETVRGRVLNLNLYLSGVDFLLPHGADPQWLKDDPSAEIVIDGRTFRADLLFADGYVIVADAVDRRQLLLSLALLDALQYGRRMVLRFDLLQEGADQSPRFDSQLVVDLRVGQAAIAAVRRCAVGGAIQATR